MINETRLLNEFLELVQIDSHSGKEGQIAKNLFAKLEELGLEVEIDKAGEKKGGETGNVIARLKGSKDGHKILFSSHMDTVVPGEGIKPIVDKEAGLVKSDGTTVLGADDKAGIAAILEALRLVKENGIETSDIEVVFSIWEEGGLFGAKNLDYSTLNAEMAFVLDSGGAPGQIITQAPAQDKIDVKIVGKPAHAGLAPETGVSAVMVAAKAIENMNLLRIDEETTANIGTINGGVATNIVMPELTIKAEARSLSNDKLDKQTAHMVETFKKAGEEMGAVVEVETSRAYGAFTLSDDEDIVKLAKTACENAKFEKIYTTSTGGGSDTNIYNENGIKAVNLGIGMQKVHTLDEFIMIQDLNDAAKMVLEIIKAAVK